MIYKIFVEIRKKIRGVSINMGEIKKIEHNKLAINTTIHPMSISCSICNLWYHCHGLFQTKKPDV